MSTLVSPQIRKPKSEEWIDSIQPLVEQAKKGSENLPKEIKDILIKIIVKEKEAGNEEIFFTKKIGRYHFAVIADLHGNLDVLVWMVDEILKHPDWFVILLGDIFDDSQHASYSTYRTKSLEEELQEVTKIMLPILARTVVFVWGNHEARLFRNPSGKGTAPNIFNMFFQVWKQLNSNAVILDPDRSCYINVNGCRIVAKHGKQAGQNWGVMEYRAIMVTREDIDVVLLGHTHNADYMPLARESEDGIKNITFIRVPSAVVKDALGDVSNFLCNRVGFAHIVIGKGKLEDTYPFIWKR